MERGKAAGLTTHAPERMTARPLDLFSVSRFKWRNEATFTPSAAVGLPGRKLARPKACPAESLQTSGAEPQNGTEQAARPLERGKAAKRQG